MAFEGLEDTIVVGFCATSPDKFVGRFMSTCGREGADAGNEGTEVRKLVGLTVVSGTGLGMRGADVGIGVMVGRWVSVGNAVIVGVSDAVGVTDGNDSVTTSGTITMLAPAGERESDL